MNHLYGDLCIYTLYIYIYIYSAFAHVREVCLYSLHIISLYTCLEALNSSFGWWAFVLDVSVVDSFAFVWWRLDSTWMSYKIRWLPSSNPSKPGFFTLQLDFQTVSKMEFLYRTFNCGRIFSPKTQLVRVYQATNMGAQGVTVGLPVLAFWRGDPDFRCGVVEIRPDSKCWILWILKYCIISIWFIKL